MSPRETAGITPHCVAWTTLQRLEEIPSWETVTWLGSLSASRLHLRSANITTSAVHRGRLRSRRQRQVSPYLCTILQHAPRMSYWRRGDCTDREGMLHEDGEATMARCGLEDRGTKGAQAPDHHDGCGAGRSQVRQSWEGQGHGLGAVETSTGPCGQVASVRWVHVSWHWVLQCSQK